MKKYRRLLAMLLCVVMVLTMTGGVWAADGETQVVDPEALEAAITAVQEEPAEAAAAKSAGEPVALAADSTHTHTYRLADDSYEATDTTGGYRHYRCTVCMHDYSYTTDPMVYKTNPKTGEPVTFDYAANPYLPNYEFMPDNELHVLWSKEDSEWRAYALGSHDTGLTGWCGPDISCWSAPVYDLTDWRFEAILRDTGRFFACDFNYDLLTDQCVLYAFPFFGNPEMNGTHLWVNGSSVPDSYFDTPLTEGEGVVGLDGVNHFDPAIYIDEEGNFLCTYDQTTDGTKHCQLAKVNANDRTKVEWYADVKMAEGEKNTNGFNPKEYEGSTIDLVEVDGHSYWVVQYSYKSDWSAEDYEKDVDGDHRWWPLAYVYSDPDMTMDELKDFTGWHWGGIIGDNGGFLRKDVGSDEVTEHDDPTTCWGNNHGGLAYINGEWYLSNHRHTSNGAGRQGFLRKVDIYTEGDKLVIEPVEYTSSIGDSIDAYHTWPAYIACHLWPTVFSEAKTQTLYIDTPLRGAPENYWDMIYDNPEYAEHRSPVVGIVDGAEVGFKYLNFGQNEEKLNLSVLVSQEEGYVDGVLNVYIDAPSTEEGGTKIGEISVNAADIAAAGVSVTGSDDTAWSKLTAAMEPVSGIHGVYFVFTSEEEGTICKLDEFTFSGHEHSYRLVDDSYEATATEGGYRHYACACGDEYSYETDPTVYKVNPKTGEAITFDYAANPYLPNYEFMPDNELHVLWSKEDNEWRAYALGSHDKKLSGWCGDDITCWSAPVYDLTDWRFEAILRDTGTFFACDFNYDLLTDQCVLYAFPFFGNPEMRGTHLWVNGSSVPDSYFDIPLTEGAGVVGLDGVNLFDPAIYIDEEGNFLCTYDSSNGGTKHCQIAKVNANDRTKVEWTVDVKMAEGEHNTNGFNPKEYEGSTIDYVEVDGHSYWVVQYSYKSDWSAEDYEKDVDGDHRWWPLAYVYSDPDMTMDELKDFTGWHWGGIIGDNGGFLRKDAGSDEVTEHDDPTNCWGNNHGSLAFINGEWFLSNHRHTSNGAGRQGFLRKVDIYTEGDKLVIEPVEYTSSIGESIDAYHTWPAYIACHLWPTVFSEAKTQTLFIDTPLRGAPADYWETIYDNPEYAEHRSPVVGIVNGAEVGFKYLNFGENEETLNLSVLVSKESGYVDGTMDVYIDAPSAEEGGTKIGSIDVTSAAISAAGVSVTGPDGTEWSELSAPMQPVSGIHSVYFVFASNRGRAGTICKLDEFTFSGHEHSYRLADDSYEATATEGGYRHYACACGEEYSYETDPTVYKVNPKTGEAITFDYAANPYLPNYEFMPDNELHVLWSKEDNEWRAYALGSHDKKLSGWCGDDITCWSAPVYDLTDWRFEAILRDTGTFFACDFNYDLLTDQCVLYAFPFFGNPEMNGTHLWVNGNSVPDSYFDTPLTEGAGVVGLDGVNLFDPAIYIDEEGNFLCTYDSSNGGTKHCQIAKVNANDRTKVEWTADVKMAKGEHNTNGFNPKEYEGSTIDLVEVDGHSYWVVQYSYKSDWSAEDYEKDVDGDHRWWPLAYVYSDPDMTMDELKDFTGWHWGGIIGDNGGFLRKDAGSNEVTEHDDPTNCWGNNHGSLTFINGEWFLSNHRHTSNGAGRQGFLRKVDIYTEGDKLIIEPVEYTSSIGESIDAYHTWPAYIACHLWPTVFSEAKTQTLFIDTPLRGAPADYWETIYDNPEYAEHRSPVVGIVDGSEVGFKYLNFGEYKEMSTLTVLVSQEEGYVDGVLNVYIDAPSIEEGGTKIGEISVNAADIAKAGVSVTGSDGTEWSELSASMDQAVNGIHGVYFVFTSEEEGTICKLDEFTFSGHRHDYRRADDSYEATATEGGYRHYVCACGDEYSYETDPTIYKVNPKTGEAITFDYAVNPYLPNYEFMPDNELHVFWSREDSEWRVYAVGSHDTKLSGWCGPDITCWSAPVYDLTDWRYEAVLRDTGTFFACDFNYDLETDQAILYAFPFFGNPEMRGTHLWVNGNSVPDSYFDTPLTEGAGVVGLDGVNLFDPAIYIDEEGNFLCTYDSSNGGTKHCQIAKVNANDRTKVEWTVDVKMAEGEKNTNGFNPKEYEGSTIDLVEIDGHTYWVVQYSYKSDWSAEDYEKDVDGDHRWWPLAYVYSDPDMTMDELKDFTGWHWGGIIGDNGGFFRKDAGSDEITEHDDPTNCWGNNHGGLAFINGEWYISNHRHTSNGAGRQGFLEKVTMYVEDGKLVIEPTEYTSSIGESIDAYHTWPAYIACHLWPTVFSEAKTQTLYIDTPLRGAPENYWDMIYDNPEYAEHRSPVVGIVDGAEVGFKYLNFGDEAAMVDLSVLVSREDVDGVLNVYIDAPSEEKGGTKIGAIEVSAAAIAKAGVSVTGSDGTKWSRLAASMDVPVSGIHGVYFVFTTEGEGTICKLDEFTFTKGEIVDKFLFDDVQDESSYYFDPVYWAVDNGITNGVSANLFAPDNKCSRAEVVTFLWRAAGEPAPTTENNPFTDAVEGSYYYDAMLWAVEKGITTGTGDGTTFSPDMTCTRGQIVTFLYRYAGSPEVTTTETAFTDIVEGSYYYDAVLWAVENGVTTGTSATTFAPEVTCSRAEVVTFLYRLLAK